MPFTIPAGQAFRSFARLAPPPQPQSSTLASGARGRNWKPQSSRALWPRFMAFTISFPPRP